MTALGALAGALLAAGILVVIAGVRRRRTPTPADRIAPYVAGGAALVVRRDDLGTRTDATLVERLVAPTVATWRARVPSPGDAALQARLVAAGEGGTTPEQFRIRQLVWGLTSVGAATALLALLAATSHAVRPVAATVLVVVGGVLGVLLCDRALTAAVRRRREAVVAGLPVVADLLALAVGSGESPAAALARVARTARGPLAEECDRACREASSGHGLVEALESMSRRLDVPAVSRFVDGVAIAVQRGTPLADVLRAQAGDARAEQHRQLLETAGRKELLMLIPVVFLVLPTVVLVAIYPAVTSLAAVGG